MTHSGVERSFGLDLTSPVASALGALAGVVLGQWFARASQRREHLQAYRAVIYSKQFEALSIFTRRFYAFHLALQSATVARGHYPLSKDERKQVQAETTESFGLVSGCLTEYGLVFPDKTQEHYQLYLLTFYVPEVATLNLQQPHNLEEFLGRSKDAYWNLINAARNALGVDRLEKQTQELIEKTL